MYTVHCTHLIRSMIYHQMYYDLLVASILDFMFGMQMITQFDALKLSTLAADINL